MDPLGGLVLAGMLIVPAVIKVPVAVQMVSMSVMVIFFGEDSCLGVLGWSRVLKRDGLLG